VSDGLLFVGPGGEHDAAQLSAHLALGVNTTMPSGPTVRSVTLLRRSLPGACP
jgi:hypothetical protein